MCLSTSTHTNETTVVGLAGKQRATGAVTDRTDVYYQQHVCRTSAGLDEGADEGRHAHEHGRWLGTARQDGRHGRDAAATAGGLQRNELASELAAAYGGWPRSWPLSKPEHPVL